MFSKNVEVKGEALLIKWYHGSKVSHQSSVDIPKGLRVGDLPWQLCYWVNEALQSGKQTSSIHLYEQRAPGCDHDQFVTLLFQRGFLQLKLSSDDEEICYLSPVSQKFQ